MNIMIACTPSRARTRSATRRFFSTGIPSGFRIPSDLRHPEGNPGYRNGSTPCPIRRVSTKVNTSRPLKTTSSFRGPRRKRSTHPERLPPSRPAPPPSGPSMNTRVQSPSRVTRNPWVRRVLVYSRSLRVVVRRMRPSRTRSARSPQGNHRLSAQRPFAVTDLAEMGVQDADSPALLEEVEDVRRKDAARVLPRCRRN